MENKTVMAEDVCPSCIWYDKQGLCPFARCVRLNGFIADHQIYISKGARK